MQFAHAFRGIASAVVAAAVMSGCSGGASSSITPGSPKGASAPGAPGAFAAPATAQNLHSAAPFNPASLASPTLGVDAAKFKTDGAMHRMTTTASTVFSDDFNSGSAPQWSVLDGTWKPISVLGRSYEYQAQDPNGDNDSFAGSANWTNYTLDVDVRPETMSGSRRGASIAGRVQDASHFFEVELVTEWDGTRHWEFWRNDAGNYVNLANGSFDFVDDQEYRLRLTFAGSQISASIAPEGTTNYTTLASVTDAHYPAGKIGLRGWGGATPTFDNVVVSQTVVTPDATAAPVVTTVKAIAAGGPASGTFAADANYNVNGTFTYGTSHAIDLSGVTNAAPQSVYQNGREGSTVAYAIPGLTANAPYSVRLHFAEPFYTTTGQRMFNIFMNGAQVATNYDIVAAAGAPNRAVVKTVATNADGSGSLSIKLVGMSNNARIDGIEIQTSNASVSTPSPATAPTATPTAVPTPIPTPVPTSMPTTASGAFVAPAGYVAFPNGPFAKPVVNPQIDPMSDSMMASIRLPGENYFMGGLQFSTNTTGPTDSATPVYTAHNSDPVYTIHCMYYSGCPIEGVQEHIPVGAIPAGRLGYTTFTDDGRHDQHMAVKNVDTGLEVDTWLTPQPNGVGGVLNVGYGGQYSAASNGFNQPGGATAAGFALGQGRIRPADILAGHIPQALFLVTPCENGVRYPASGGDAGSVAGCPPMGAHVWLDSSFADIEASGAPNDMKVILKAMHEFGGYIGDRCTSCSLYPAIESGHSYTAFGLADPWVEIASHFPGSGTNQQYQLAVSSGNIDLFTHLRIITN
ncbi:MAG: hypothetical protein NVS4B5_00350 [Vulcanimicrobiaceae bacterium]